MDNQKIVNKLVHEFDLLKTLENFGLLSNYQDKKLKCNWCNEVILEPKDFGLFKKNGNKIFVCCSKADCIYRSQQKA